MTLKRLVITSMAILGLALSAANAAEQTDPEITRAYLEKWVQLRTLISEEENDWRADKESITSSIELIKGEMEGLEKAIEEAKENQSFAEQQRKEITNENDELKQAASAVGNQLAPLEEQILRLVQFFPRDLRKQIELLEQRVPRPGTAVRASTGERLQNIVGILSQVEKFNRSVTISTDVQTLPNGDNAQVDTVYLGLAAAFFVDGKGTYAGILTPSQGEWKSTPRPDLAPQIRAIVDIYRRDKLAEFVPVPVEIK
jgi:hypothetical protein